MTSAPGQIPSSAGGAWSEQRIVLAYFRKALAETSTSAPLTDGGFVFYRPRLTMRVVSFEVERDEWNAAVAWSMALEEA